MNARRTVERDCGRGETATRDMKRRIAALRTEGSDVVEALWRRFVDAAVEDLTYDYADRQ